MTTSARHLRRPLPGLLVATIVALSLAVPPGAPAEAAPCTVTRLSGPTRIQTAVAISRDVRDRATTVVVARADAYPDALAAVPLAEAMDAPLLLSDGDRLSAATASEIERLQATEAVVLGGTTALSRAVANGIRDLGVEVRRIQGATRFATAANVARQLPGTPSQAIIVEGANPSPTRGWPDAVVAGPLAAGLDAPILMVTADTVPAETAAVLADLGIDRLTVIGGPVSVSHGVLTALADSDGNGSWDRKVERVSGLDRYATSTEVAWEQVRDLQRPSSLWLATGRSFPDALAAGAAAAATGGAVVLVDGTRDLAIEPAAALRRDLAGSLDRVVITGGPSAIGQPVADAANAWMCSGDVPPLPGGDGVACEPGGLANHVRTRRNDSLAALWEQQRADPTRARALEIMRRSGPFTRHVVTQPTLRATFEEWLDRINETALGTAYHETLHFWQHEGDPPYTGTLISCLALDRDARGVLGISMPDGAPPPSVIADELRARAHELFPADSFERNGIDDVIDTYLACPPSAEPCSSSHEYVSSLFGEFHSYVTGYELQWTWVRSGAQELPDPRTSGYLDGGAAVIPGMALYVRYLRDNDPAAYQEFIDRNAFALGELWRMFERNYPGRLFGDANGDWWRYFFGGGIPQIIAEATSARAGVETPPRPS